MPDAIKWGLAWIRLERAIQRKIDQLDPKYYDDDPRNVGPQIETLQEVQEMMARLEPKEHKRERLGTGLVQKKTRFP